MNTLILHGKLADKYGEKHTYAGKCLSECLRLLYTNYPKIKELIREKKWHVVKGEIPEKGKCEDMKLDTNTENAYLLEDNQTYHIIPVIAGSGGDIRWVNIIIGAVLIIIGVVLCLMPGGQAVGVPLIVGGAGMVIGGAIGLIWGQSPVLNNMHQQSERPEERASYLFSGPLNKQAQGGPFPLIYGRCMVGSVIGSIGVENERI